MTATEFEPLGELEDELEEEAAELEPFFSSSFENASRRPLPLSQGCRTRLKSVRVAVVGAGLAGLMAAREIARHGANVILFEARDQVGGRVLSNTSTSIGRIVEEGAELIGSFHTTWLRLAKEFGLALISRMDSELYQRAGLDVKLTLDKPLSMAEINELEKAMEDRVLRPIALMAKALIRDPSQPWLQDILRKFDGLTVQEALPKFCKIAKRTTGNKDERLWKMLEFKLVNDEVAPLDKMNFLGLLCKVKAGQGERLGTDKSNLMGYWNELEIFRCADGCQQLARALERAEIQDKTGRQTYLNTAVTAIDIMKQGAQVTWAPVVNGMPVPGHGKPALFDFVVLAIPPSVWDDVPIKADGKVVRLKDEIGDMGMEPAVKFFSDVKERFWIKEHAAPYGGALALGQVWEGTDNQTRTGDQSIVLSVFAGPILPGGLAPAEKDFKKGLQDLYRGYSSNSKPNGTFLADWPNRRFIMTGYASPRTNQVFSIGRKLSEPFRDRLFFAGEHTHMAFFGYMEGALRSGERAAHALIRKACGLMQERVPAPVMRTVRATPVRKEIA